MRRTGDESGGKSLRFKRCSLHFCCASLAQREVFRYFSRFPLGRTLSASSASFFLTGEVMYIKSNIILLIFSHTDLKQIDSLLSHINCQMGFIIYVVLAAYKTLVSALVIDAH